MIEQLDQGIGSILDSLELWNILNNTIVIFMSDNGPINGWRVPQEEMRYNAGLRDQKFTIYEGGIRTQCYWRWGDHWEPSVVENVAAHIDVVPTLTALLGIELPENAFPLDGISLKSVLEGSKSSTGQRIFFQKYALSTLEDPAPFPGSMARRGTWKMVNGSELFDLEKDVGETTNLAQQHPGILQELNASYTQWYQDIADDRDLQKIPIAIGHEQENPVYLQPHHGKASGNVKFWGNRGLTGERRGTHPSGVDSDWTAEWQARGDAIEWEVSFIESGVYSFRIVARDSTSREVENLRLTINGQVLTEPAEALPLSPEWVELNLGSASIEMGSTLLQLMLHDDIDSCLEVRALIVEK